MRCVAGRLSPRTRRVFGYEGGGETCWVPVGGALHADRKACYWGLTLKCNADAFRVSLIADHAMQRNSELSGSKGVKVVITFPVGFRNARNIYILIKLYCSLYDDVPRH